MVFLRGVLREDDRSLETKTALDEQTWRVDTDEGSLGWEEVC